MSFRGGGKTSAEMLQKSHQSTYSVGRVDQGSEEVIKDIRMSGAREAPGRGRYEKIWTVK